MQNRIQELDVMRVFAMLFVITYHFGMEYGARELPYYNFFCTTPNYDFGNVAVTIFMMLSGGLLYKKYKDTLISQKSIVSFYKKRLKTIYIPFWICNLYVVISMIRHAVAGQTPFFAGHPAKLLLTVTGFDGYTLLFGMENYAFVGDWFIGAILFLYLIFPLLAKAYCAFPKILLATLTCAYFTQFLTGSSLISALPFTLTLKFVLGFLIMEHLSWAKKLPMLIIAFAVLLTVSFVKLDCFLQQDFLGSLAALCCFAIFYNLAAIFPSNLFKVIQKLSALSYCVFLLQHVLIRWTLAAYAKVFEKIGWEFSCEKSLMLLFVTIIVIFACAFVLNKVSQKVLKRMG